MIHSSGHLMELDVFVEDLKLAFEYQGEQHYKPVYHMGGDFETQKTIDKEKREACKQVQLYSMYSLEMSSQQLIPNCHINVWMITYCMVQNGVTLIEVPYWWDRTKGSLEATVHKVRP